MSEAWLRLLVVVGALAVTATVVLIQRERARGPIRQLGSVRLAAGLHYFSSTACPTCGEARSSLVARLGEEGFSEHVWEESPGLFSELGVASVPSFLVVDGSGRASLFPGRVAKALAAAERAQVASEGLDP